MRGDTDARRFELLRALWAWVALAAPCVFFIVLGNNAREVQGGSMYKPGCPLREGPPRPSVCAGQYAFPRIGLTVFECRLVVAFECRLVVVCEWRLPVGFECQLP